MDIEVDALDNTAGIDRRNKAIETVQDWAAATGREPEISYTLPTTTKGLAASGLALLRNAMANGARADVANIMTLDYYDNALHDMAQDTTKTVAQGLYDRLARRCPSKTPDQLWGVIGITEMPGVDDFGWPRRDFSLTASPATATLKAGGSTTSTVQTSATAGTARTVTLTASGAPAGVTASLIPPQ
ncbi:hypothetical protein [Streptomyces sp. NRRL B-1347]|uniref:hypothetical protein n=1 Tax=Streptomyces sp. NRRL B-1347 TaxID=1476877 RepID=UPI0007C4F9E5